MGYTWISYISLGNNSIYSFLRVLSIIFGLIWALADEIFHYIYYATESFNSNDIKNYMLVVILVANFVKFFCITSLLAK